MTQVAETTARGITFPVSRETLEALKALTFGVANDSSRPVLEAVHFVGGRAEVTDSYMAAVLDISEGFDGVDVMIDGKELREACSSAIKTCKAVGETSDPCTLTLEPDAVTVAAFGASFRLVAVDGQFPNMLQLWPDYSTGDGPPLFGLNASVLTKVFKTLNVAKIQASETTALKFTCADALKPFVIEPTNPGNKARALIMPVCLP